jgi:hypothetical protein
MRILPFLSNHLHRIFFGTLAVLFIAQVTDYRKPESWETWKRPYYADAAGYYIYLPAACVYDFDARALPADASLTLGNGFDQDVATGKIKTKYTWGVALMQAPFFGLVHWYNTTYFKKADGISLDYDITAVLATACYVYFGLLLLYAFLRFYFSVPVSLLVILLLLAGTNLLFYLRVYPGMSHGYSFFLVALLLFVFKKHLTEPKRRRILLVYLLFGLLTLIRPTNVLLGAVLLLLDVQSKAELKARLQLLTAKAALLPGLVLFSVPFIPQFIYWNYAYGSYFSYSYENEGFSNWNNPQFGITWLAPQNGLLPYAPLFALLIIGGVWLCFRKNKTAWLITAIFFVQSYLFASWHTPYFGNSIGNRNFIDFMPLYALLSGLILQPLVSHPRSIIRIAPALLLVPCCVLSLRVNGGTNYFFAGNSDWDWNEYVYQYYRKRVTVNQDYESLPATMHRQYAFAASGRYVYVLDERTPRSPYLRIVPAFYGPNNFREVHVESNVRVADTSGINPHVVCYIDSMGKAIGWNTHFFKNELRDTTGWQTIRATFILPRENTGRMPIMINIVNGGKNKVVIDDTKVILY